jgi:Na+-driven multidrug efflux pump
MVFSKRTISRLSLRCRSNDPEVTLSIMRVGLPSLIRQMLNSVATITLNHAAMPYGDAAIAAMSIIQKYSTFVMCVGLGIGQGFQPFASFNYELKEYDRVKKGTRFLIIFGTLSVGALATLGFIFANPIVQFFQKAEGVAEVGVPALRYASIGLWFLPISVACNMLYQSIRKAAMASFMAIMRSGAVLIPVLLICATFFKLNGIIMAQPIADVITGLVSLPFYFMFLKKTPSTAQAKGIN